MQPTHPGGRIAPQASGRNHPSQSVGAGAPTVCHWDAPYHDFLIYTCGRLHSNHSESEDQNPDETRRRYTPVGDIQSGFPGAGGTQDSTRERRWRPKKNASHDMTTRPVTTLDNQTCTTCFLPGGYPFGFLDAANAFLVRPFAFSHILDFLPSPLLQRRASVSHQP